MEIPLRLISHPLRPYLHDAPTVSILAESKVLDLKLAIGESWEGHPKVDGITLTLAGRLLADGESMSELMRIGAERSQAKPVIHVMVKPSAWTTEFTPPIPSNATPPPAATPTTPMPPTSTIPAISTPPLNLRNNLSNSRSPTPSPTTPITPYTTYLSHLAQLIPLQRSLLLLNLQKSHHFYASLIQHRLVILGWAEENIMSLSVNSLASSEEVSSASMKPNETEIQWKARMATQEVEEVVELLKGCGLWELVELQEKEAVDHITNWTERDSTDIAGKRKGEFEVVQLGGLPFLLHTPTPFMSPIPCPPLEPFLALKRAQSILQILTTMLQLLLTFQPTAGSVAYGRSMLQATPGIQSDLAPPPNLLRGEVPGLGIREVGIRGVVVPPRRRPVISIVFNLNLTRILSIFIPLLFLGLKLGFLLWIFGRHASQTKQMILGGIALVYLIWEGISLYRRGNPAAVAVPRRVRVRPLPAGNVPPPADPLPPGLRQRNVGIPGVAPGAGAGVAAAGVAPVPGARVHRERTERPTPSLLSPRYWINYISAIGLASEALELGLIPRSIAGRPVTIPTPLPVINPNDRIALARERRRKALRTVMIGVVLFFGTLLPEVERKRRRALEKRAKLLESRRLSRERRAAVASEAAALAMRTAASVPPPSTVAPTPAGRAVVSDAELFKDGLPESAVASTSSAVPPVSTPVPSASVVNSESNPTALPPAPVDSAPIAEPPTTVIEPTVVVLEPGTPLEIEVEGEDEVDIAGSDEEDDLEAAREAREAEEGGVGEIF